MVRAISVKMVPGDPRLLKAVSQLTEAFRERRVTFFSGAGISRPSGLPGSPPLVASLVDAMTESLSRIRLGESSERSGVRDVISGYPLERLLDSLVDMHGDEAALGYLRVLQDATENYNHDAIAILAERKLLNYIVTLNFDVLFEQALSRRSVPFAWHLPLAADGRIPHSVAGVTVVKPHGTLPFDGLPYAPHYLAATLRYAGDRPQRETAEVFQTIAQQSPVLLVAGYSNDDWDIFPLLAAAPWSHVVWCEFVPASSLHALSALSPCTRVIRWLSSRPVESTLVMYGDVRTLLSTVLDDGNLGRSWQDSRQRIPDASLFTESPSRTALAALRLLDGTANELYRRLLPQFGSTEALATDIRLRRQWQRSISWFHHAHRRDVRMAIKMHQQLLEEWPSSGESDLEYLWDLVTLYYEYISAAKRPYLNVQWVVDLLRARRVGNFLRKEAARIKASVTANPWIGKQADRQLAHLTYYKVDLLHNWGYHLLPFSSGPLRGLTRRLFRGIAGHYREAAERFPVLDWEYHYVRGVEAGLIAGERLPLSVVREKLTEIAEMFERTGSHGHLAYVRAVEAIIGNSERAFTEVEATFFDERSGTTPAGKLRMRLLRRYFWPHSISLLQTLRDLLRYSRLQE